MSKSSHHTGNVNTLKDMEMRTDWQAHLRPAINVSVLWTQCSRVFFFRAQQRMLFLVSLLPLQGKNRNMSSERLGWLLAVLSIRASQEEKRTPFDLFHLNECLFHVEAISGALVSAAPPPAGRCRSRSIHPHQPALRRHSPSPPSRAKSHALCYTHRLSFVGVLLFVG